MTATESLLRNALYETLWMARRYVHLRNTYATKQYNDVVFTLLESGEDVTKLIHPESFNPKTIWAMDGQLGWPEEYIAKYGHDGKGGGL